MPHIEKRVGKYRTTYRVQVRIGTTLRTRTFRRITDAREWATNTEKALRDGLHVADRQDRLRMVADLLEKYRADILPDYDAREQVARSGKLAWWEARLGSPLHPRYLELAGHYCFEPQPATSAPATRRKLRTPGLRLDRRPRTARHGLDTRRDHRRSHQGRHGYARSEEARRPQHRGK
jgi:hypothetical protein